MMCEFTEKQGRVMVMCEMPFILQVVRDFFLKLVHGIGSEPLLA